MSGSKLLRLIVFDLDCTLWPFHVDLFKFSPPYRMQEGRVVDRNGAMMEPYPETREVLDHYSKVCNIAIASRTTYPQGAKSLLKLFDFEKYINYMEIYPGDKTNHFTELTTKTGLEADEMLFFDDEQRNIRDVQKLGIKSILVNADFGVTKKLLNDKIRESFLDTRKD